jgi:lauroyl/myristoyl acyltransferase
MGAAASGSLFELSDLRWVARQLPRKLYFTFCPVGTALRDVSREGRNRWSRSEDRPAVLENLGRVFPSKSPEELEDLGRHHFEYLKRRRLQTRLPMLPGFQRPERWPLENRQALDAALEGGKGVILAFVHFGYARLIKHILRMHGYPLVVVGAGATSRIRNEEERQREAESWSAFRRALYHRVEVVVNLTDQRDLVAGLNVRPYFQVLQEGKCLLLAGDSDHSVNFESFPVLGRPMPFPTGFMRIAMTSGAPLMPVFAVEGEGHYGIRVVLGEPLEVTGGGNEPQAVRANLERFAGVYDSLARKWPALVRDWREWGTEPPAESKDLEQRLADLRGR